MKALAAQTAEAESPVAELNESGWRKLNPFTLRFIGRPQEIAYREARRPTEIRYMRVVLVLVFAITLIVVPLDLRLFPSNERSLIFLGHGTEIMVIGSLFGISFVPYFRDRHMVVMAMLAVFFAAIYAPRCDVVSAMCG